MTTLLENFPAKNPNTGWKLVAPNGKSAEVSFVKPGYVSRRMDFDNFLFQAASAVTEVETQTNFQLDKIDRQGDVWEIKDLSGTKSLQAKLLIACDGAHSVVARQVAGKKVEPEHYSAAVRAYFSGIKTFENPGMIEIILLKKFLPGYFWIFPLDNQSANVGFGMLSSAIHKRRINLKKTFYEIIHNEPIIAPRFKQAIQHGALEGMGLPLGGKKRQISGTGFMLCGDAASLIDPLNGEGIGNAMWSGLLAAQQAVSCFNQNNFNADFLKNYDQEVYRKLGPELRKKLMMQKLFNRPWLINAIINFAQNRPSFQKWLGGKL